MKGGVKFMKTNLALWSDAHKGIYKERKEYNKEGKKGKEGKLKKDK